MKRTCLLIITIVALASADLPAQSAYWVVESNKWIKNFTVVRIYDGSNKLIAERQLQRGVDISQPREVWLLNRMVRLAVKEQRDVATGRPRRTGRAWTRSTKV